MTDRLPCARKSAHFAISKKMHCSYQSTALISPASPPCQSCGYPTAAGRPTHPKGQPRGDTGGMTGKELLHLQRRETVLPQATYACHSGTPSDKLPPAAVQPRMAQEAARLTSSAAAPASTWALCAGAALAHAREGMQPRMAQQAARRSRPAQQRPPVRAERGRRQVLPLGKCRPRTQLHMAQEAGGRFRPESKPTLNLNPRSRPAEQRPPVRAERSRRQVPPLGKRRPRTQLQGSCRRRRHA